MSSEDEKSASQSPVPEWAEDARAALVSLSEEREEKDPQRFNRFCQAQEVEAYKARIPDVIECFLSHLPVWTTLETAYLVYVRECATPEEASENIGKFKAHIRSSGGRLSDAIAKVYPSGITHPLHIEHGKVLANFGHPTNAAQEIDRTVAIAYLANNRVPREALPDSIMHGANSKAKQSDSVTEIDNSGATLNWIRNKEVAAAIIARIRGTGHTESNIKRIVTEWCNKGKVKSIGKGTARRIDPDAVSIIAGHLLSKDADRHDSFDD